MAWHRRGALVWNWLLMEGANSVDEALNLGENLIDVALNTQMVGWMV